MDLGYLDGCSSDAYAINDRGRVNIKLVNKFIKRCTSLLFLAIGLSEVNMLKRSLST